MSHMIDTTVEKSGAAFYVGRPAWHRLGVVISEAPSTAEAIKLLKADYPIEGCAVFARLSTGEEVQIADKKAIVRMDSKKVLSVMGEDYRIFSNTECFDFMDSVVGAGLARYETAGLLDEGRRIWMLARMPKTLAVGNDVVNPYVLLASSHDGTLAVRMLATTVRVECNNMLNMALGRGAKDGITITHKQNLKHRVEEAKKALGLIAERIDEHQEELNALVKVQMNTVTLRKFFEDVFPPPETKTNKKVKVSADLLEQVLEQTQANSESVEESVKAALNSAEEAKSRALTIHTKLMDTLIDNFEVIGENSPDLKGSALCALNAVTGYCDHQMGTRASNDAARLNNRVDSIMFGSAARKKMDAFEKVLELVPAAASR